MRRAWPVLVLMLLVLVALRMRPPGFSTSSSAPKRSRPVSEPSETEEVATASAGAPDRTSNAPPPDPAPVEEKEAEIHPKALRWLLANQAEDGGWGEGTSTIDGVLIGRTGMTGLALLSFLGSGYSHLSKDTIDGRCAGDAVRNALAFLKDDLRQDGSFRSARGGLDQAIAALALSEAYGMTGSHRYKDAAQAAISALGGLQLQDGSWGDPATTFWAADAFKSAEIADLALPPTAYRELSAWYDRRGSPDAAEMLARMFIDKRKDHPSIQAAVSRLSAEPPSSGHSLAEIYARARAMFQVDGPSGPAWKAWNEPFKTAILQRPPPEGLSNRVVHESLSALSLQIYYRYAHVFGAK